MNNNMEMDGPLLDKIDHSRSRYPCCIVWTPIPVLTWLFPIIGHVGIATSAGIIRDFAGPYFVSEDKMAFGKPTMYVQLDPDLCIGGLQTWDRGIHDASEEYKNRMHNLFCDNCHSHVAFSLNLMEFKGSSSWNMVKVCFLILSQSKFVSIWAALKTWLPFFIILGIITLAIVLTRC